MQLPNNNDTGNETALPMGILVQMFIYYAFCLEDSELLILILKIKTAYPLQIQIMPRSQLAKAIIYQFRKMP